MTGSKELNLILKTLTIIGISFMLTSCSRDFNKKEINEIDLIQALGIDYINNEYVLTAAYSGIGVGDENTTGVELINSKGSSAYEAYENMKIKNKNNITLGHASFYIIGETAAQNGIKKSIDFLLRDQTIKMDAFVFVAKEKQAKNLIERSIENEAKIYQDLNAISQKEMQVIKRIDNGISKIINNLESEFPTMIPCIVLEENGISIIGSSVFKGEILYGYLDYETSRGVDLLNNNIKKYPIYIDGKVSLLANNIKVDMNLDDNGKSETLNINIKFNSTVKEIIDEDDFFTKAKLDYYNEAQKEYIKGIVNKAIEFSEITGINILKLKNVDHSNVIFNIKSDIQKAFIF